MPRSHPPTLLTSTARTIREAGLVLRGECVLIAVSGGPDSMALLHVLASLRPKLGHRVRAHGVDHGLRDAAAGELDLAERFARSLDVPFDRTCVSVAPGGNLQARARSARYAALRAAAASGGCARIATAHHLRDRAETVLLRLLRGAGPRGMAVLPPRAGCLVRPMIHAPRAAIDQHIERHRVPFSVDPSNVDPRFLRVRVRYQLLPLLRELSPGIEEHLCALADQLDASAVPPPPLALDTAPARGSLQAIAALLGSRSPRARVPLKGELVAWWDPASSSLAITPSSGLRPFARRARVVGGTTPPQVPPFASVDPSGTAGKGGKHK